jgi:hypothetical protein
VSCPELETLAAWCLDELPEAAAESFEEHYFSCERCLEQASSLLRLVRQLRASLPPVLTSERRRALEVARPTLPVMRVRTGERASLHMSEEARLGLWLLQAPLEQVSQVDFDASSADGVLQFSLQDVPFDVVRGEVALACQLHYRALPGSPVIHARLTAVGPSGRQPLGEYILDHVFEAS